MLLLDTFLGRFHPLTVHLPIGFLVLGILLEWFYRNEQTQKFVAFAWLSAGISAMMAAGLGWLLAESGGYDEDTLFWHRWLGIGLGVLAIGVFFVKNGQIKVGKIGNQVLNIGTLVLLGVVGHLGGNMTHGSDYLLENAPQPIKNLLGAKEAIVTVTAITKPTDSIFVYADLIEPIFAEKCMHCHNDEVQRGDLNMISPEKLQAGGDHGAVLVSGDAPESELFRRVTLLPTHSKYMPLKGEPMTFQEIRLLEWWLNEGASFEARLSDQTIAADIATVLKEQYEIDLSEKSYFEKNKVAAVSQSTIQKLTDTGFEVKTLMEGNGWLEVSYEGEKLEDLSPLLDAKEQITWLDVSNTQLNDETLSIVNELPNLTRLRLQNNPITDAGIQQLTALLHLTSLNLHHTEITDETLSFVTQFPALKRLYVWETKVTNEGVDALRKERSEVEVDHGFMFAAVVEK